MIEREARQREKNDALLTEDPGLPLRAPIVYLLDDVPVNINQRSSKRVTSQQDSWSLLVVVELLWQEPKDPSALPKREARLRLARAYPKRNEEAWMLVLNELPVVPDFIIADAASAIKNAYNRYYEARKPTFIPSLYHIHKNIREVLQKVPKGSGKSGKKVFLSKSLNEAVSFMSRDDLVRLTPKELSDCWDNLIAEVVRLGGKPKGINAQRVSNEPRMLESIAALQNNPQLPASNAAVESRIRLDLEPFLTNRKSLYRNLARTNFLLDLAVCRSQGAFIDLTKLTKRIRESNESANGWAPAPRAVTDHQPRGTAASSQIYASLLSAPIIAKLSAARRITPALPKVVHIIQSTVQNPGAGSGRRKGSKNKSKSGSK